jgi:FRG domain
MKPKPNYGVRDARTSRLGAAPRLISVGGPMPLERKEVESLSSLVDAVLELYKESAALAFLWFRGLSCASYELLPKLMRDTKPVDDVFERELRLLTRFRQRSMAYWPAGYQQDDWEHLFAMQHNGLPTRLLDWSENLFVAAYFALAAHAAETHNHEGNCIPVIWCINPVQWNRSMPGLSEYGDTIHVLTTADEELAAYGPRTNRKRYRSPVAIYGTHNSERIVAQRGTFVVWGNEARPLEEVAAEQHAVVLSCFELCGDPSVLFRDLQALGFTETMIFPEMSYLAEELGRAEGWRK